MAAMCGRASLAKTNPDEIADQLDADVDPRARVGWHARYNLAPTQQTIIVAPREKRRLIEPAVWGWKRVVGPPKADGRPTEKLLINAMAETAGDKVTFRKALRERRAVLPVTGYYEWAGPPKDRRPIHFTPREGELLLLAAIYADEKDSEFRTFMLLTTGANKVVSGIHNRMPVIIPASRLDEWLFEGVGDLLAPAPEDLLTAAAVSKRVNTGADGPECWATDGAADDERLAAALALFPRPIR
jgi:putative SOS response-associated peptidase YedK